MPDQRKDERSRTGPKPTFATEDVVAAALKIGLERFTLSAVAQDLGVTAPSLYRIASSRDALVDLCLAHIAAEFVLPDASLSWQQQLNLYVEDVWRAAETHSGFAVTLYTHPGAHAHIQAYALVLIDNVLAAGFPGDHHRVAFALDFIGDTILSTHIGVTALRGRGEDGRDNVAIARARVEAAHVDAAGSTFLAVDESWADRGFLDSKIDFIIKGLEAGL